MDLLPSVSAYFRAILREALRAQRLEPAEHTEFYLVNLLTEYAAAPLDPAPLGPKLAGAASASPHERALVLKEVGDTSLYVSGFFAESLTRRLLSVDYYAQLGRAAYGQLAQTSRLTSDLLRAVYDELSGGFIRFVTVFAMIRQSTTLASTCSDEDAPPAAARGGAALRPHGLLVLPRAVRN